jgi:branched-subunit amino acid aminotransferase/4-amino-4-deoxychorismate lyase
MEDPPIIHVEVDGRAVQEQPPFPAFTYGHFTAMQVRGGGVRGLKLHLQRLDAGNRELFGTGLAADLVRRHIRHALEGRQADASVRVYVGTSTGGTSMMVTVRAPIDMPDAPWSLLPVPYQRPLPHTKHLGDFGQTHFRRAAERSGFDDALLTGDGGVVSECAIANLAVFDGSSVIWPDAPALAGITMQLLEPALDAAGIRSRHAPVLLDELPSYAAAFVTNARGIAPVARIDELSLPVDASFMRTVQDRYASLAWDPI